MRDHPPQASERVSSVGTVAEAKGCKQPERTTDMDKLTQAERWEVAKLAMDEGEFGSMDQAISWLGVIEPLARSLHRLYVHQCNRALTAIEEQRIKGIEQDIKSRFALHRLGLYLNGDPRGNPVGILTPKTGKYNTMGGTEAGWRL